MHNVNSKKTVHIATDFSNAPNKFVPDFELFLNGLQEAGENEFFYFSDLENKKNHYKETFKNYLKLFKLIRTSDQVVFHSLPTRIARIAFPLMKWGTPCYMAVWGGEVYFKGTSDKSLRQYVSELIESFFIKSLDGLITSIDADYKSICEKYGKNYKRLKPTVFYPSNVVPENIKEINFEDKKYIMVGTSALERNNHIRVLSDIAKVGLPKGKVIFLPLSYGDSKYAEHVEATARQLFKEHELYIEHDFISLLEYQNILNKVSIALFDNDGQQGLGNIRNLLYFGAKVYLKAGSVSYDFLTKQGFKVFIIDDLDFCDDSFSKRNKEVAMSYYSKAILERSLLEIF